MRASSARSCRACRALRAQVVHSDGHADNLLRAESGSDEIVGIIDFGDMVHAPLVQDLAVTLASFARHGEMSLENAVAQVEAWNAVLPLADEELEILHDLTLLRLATALCLYDFRIHATEKPEAWLTEERPDIVRALSKFLALDRAEVHERYRAACGRAVRAPSSVDIAELRERRSRALGPSYRLFYDRPVHLVRGEGTWLFDADGRRYLDCYNNVASVGHCHPHVVAALSRQAATLNTHTRYLHDNVVRYAERLTATMPEPLSGLLLRVHRHRGHRPRHPHRADRQQERGRDRFRRLLPRQLERGRHGVDEHVPEVGAAGVARDRAAAQRLPRRIRHKSGPTSCAR